MAAILQKQSSPWPSPRQMPKQKQDVVFASYVHPDTRRKQDIRTHRQTPFPTDGWQQQHNGAPLDMTSCCFQPMYDQQLSAHHALSLFSQQHSSHHRQNSKQPPLARARTPNTQASPLQGPLLQVPRSVLPPDPLVLSQGHAKPVSDPLRNRQNHAHQHHPVRRHGSHRPPQHCRRPTKSSSASSSTAFSVTATSSDLSASDRRSSVTSVSSSLSELSLRIKRSLSSKLRLVFGTKPPKSNPATSAVTNACRPPGSGQRSTPRHTRIRTPRRRVMVTFSGLLKKSNTPTQTTTTAEVVAPTPKAARPPGSELLLFYQQDTPTHPTVVQQTPDAASPIPENSRPLSTPSLSSGIQFCPVIEVHETFTSREYDRRGDSDTTCQKLSPRLAMEIKQELNEFKLHEMQVHIDSRQYTHFFL